MTVTLEEAQARLPELLQTVMLAEEPIIIERDGQPVATLNRLPRTSWPCKAGSAEHIPHWMAPDFDAPMEEFKEYME